MNKTEIAYKIVEFWHTIEFLTQESFPKDTRENRKKQRIQEKIFLGESVSEEEKKAIRGNKIRIFRDIPSEKEPYELLKEDNQVFKAYPVRGNKYHLCIGRIKREFLIERLYKILNIEDKRPEKDESEICLFALKIGSDGCYIEKSFRISPMIWGVSACICANGKLQGVIDSKKYKQELEKIEERINKIEPLDNEALSQLYQEAVSRYLEPIGYKEKHESWKGTYIYSRYEDDKTCEREDEKEEDVSELIKGFYTDDLEMVRTALKEGNYDKQSRMCKDVIDYIVGAYYESMGATEHICNNPVNIREDKGAIEKTLFANNAPMGKWPSKFDPALMQQIAINIGISEDEKLRKIFSVNGPPGTGKTTLLKEIIASNIVERAKLLSQYEKADDAFQDRLFSDGEVKNGGYDKYYYKYHSFKNEKITEYSMLVASCNNTAVENITKELPDGDGILKNLSPDKNNPELTEGLQKVTELFDVANSKNVEEYLFWEKDESEENKTKRVFRKKKDIYFSWLAHKLLNNQVNEKDEVSEWGMISAPMGKNTNIDRYYYNVLKDIIDSFYTNAKIDKRQESYKEIRNQFIRQYRKVEKIQQELLRISCLSSGLKKREQCYYKKIDGLRNKKVEINHKIAEKVENIKALEKSEIKNNVEITDIKNRMNNIRVNKDQKESNLDKMENESNSISDQIILLEDHRKFYEIVLGKWIKTERLNKIAELNRKKQEKKKQLENLRREFNKIQAEYNEQQNKLDEVEHTLENISNQKSLVNDEISSYQDQIKVAEEQIQRFLKTILNEKNKLKKELQKQREVMTVIDDEFWMNFESEDEKINTKIQTANPWTTSGYNREREKLFYWALQLQKEFVLSSKACRNNLNNLAMMWKYKENSEKELCNYTEKDKKASYSHLLNTLFLVTPVMSTTFASVGRFLKYIEEPGSLGLLIVDEAGQAPPHVALGALWRCKKAIIVGDPKQVEPVVTGDADAIKKAFSNDIIKPYLDKRISVQSFADRLNSYGSYIKDEFSSESESTWVGCPLVVHRRCIDPMYSISNQLSYGGTMKQATFSPKKEEEELFVKEKSLWIDIKGQESGNKNHFVKEQGLEALKIIEKSFENYGGVPDLYVISPFTTVVNGMKDLLSYSQELRKYGDDLEKWADECCGTVHKFQGKEAKEVIFLLGCDKKANGAVQWVNANIVNVAATRAKYRFYVIGDYEVWSKSKIFKITKDIIG